MGGVHVVLGIQPWVPAYTMLPAPHPIMLERTEAVMTTSNVPSLPPLSSGRPHFSQPYLGENFPAAKVIVFIRKNLGEFPEGGQRFPVGTEEWSRGAGMQG